MKALCEVCQHDLIFNGRYWAHWNEDDWGDCSCNAEDVECLPTSQD